MAKFLRKQLEEGKIYFRSWLQRFQSIMAEHGVQGGAEQLTLWWLGGKEKECLC
jgi:hypothetical protein